MVKRLAAKWNRVRKASPEQSCLYPIKNKDTLMAYHSRGFQWIRCAEDFASRFEARARYQPRLKLNIGEDVADAQPGSGVIHEPRSVTSDLQARLELLLPKDHDTFAYFVINQ